MTATLVSILLLICLSAFFSGSETALTAVSRGLMHQKAREDDWRAAMVNRLYNRRERLIGSILLGNNLVNILASALATRLFIQYFGEAGVFWATLVMTFLVLVFAEILPKTFAIRNPNRMALVVAPVMNVLTRLLSPLVMFLQGIVDQTLRLFGASHEDERDRETGLAEIKGTISLHAAGEETREEREMLKSVLDLAEVEVHDIMVHRRNMISFDVDRPVPEIVDNVLNSPYSRVPIWRKKPENIVGVLNAKALLRAVHAHGENLETLDIEDLAGKPWFVLETTPLAAQLRAFQVRHEHFAIVVDEYGALQGLVTLEDILEEIVGEIEDEHDVQVSGVRRQPDGSCVVDGRVAIRDLNRQFGWELPAEEASTVAGFLLHETERIPEEGHVYSFHEFRFSVVRRQKNRIMAVRITPPGREEDEEKEA